MIRLPHSSINLSEHDLAFHLQQIDIYHGLLKQGFKKKDILRYFKDHREANAQGTGDSESDITPAPSTVELVAKSPPPSENFEAVQYKDPSKRTSHEEEEDDIVQGAQNAIEDVQETDKPEDTDCFSPTTVSAPPNHRHAPRQSSLLRFAKVVSSDSTQSDETAYANKLPALPARSYRPRTETYSYNQSEASDADIVEQLSGLYITSVSESNDGSIVTPGQRSTSPMRPEAESFVPEPLGHAMSTARNMSVDHQQTLPRDTLDQIAHPTSTNHVPLAVLTPRRSSLGQSRATARQSNHSSTSVEFPSSPPIPAVGDSRHPDSSPSLPMMPVTPTPARRAHRDAQTEPRNHGPQYLDGSFPVYNDFLPASSQPQTPADLARNQVITVHEAAYTAPVGMIHMPTASRLHRTTRLDHVDAGEQSPTRRAVGMRERRARELRRSVRAEGLRLQRLRRQDREILARGMDGDEEQRDRELDRGRDGPGPAIFTERWEDQLEGDRVGDENWEAELDEMGVGGRRGIRVTSGNANAGRGWLEERQV